MPMNKVDVEIDPKTAIADGHECVVLSALMNGSDSLPVCADDFSSPPNRTIFERVIGLSDRCFIAVTDALRLNGELDNVGGAGRITWIADLPHDKDNLNYALDQVLEHSRQRQVAKIGQQLQSGGITPEQAREKLNEVLSQPKTTEREPRIRFFPPCLSRDFVPDNDIVLIGSCHIVRGEVFVIGGEPGVGKSLPPWRTVVDFLRADLKKVYQCISGFFRLFFQNPMTSVWQYNYGDAIRDEFHLRAELAA